MALLPLPLNAPGAALPAAVDVAGVMVMRETLGAVSDEMTDVERIDLIRALEELKSAAAAVQARVAVDFDASQRSAQSVAGVRAAQQGRGVASQIGLARKDSPFRGSRHLGLAKVLVHEMPHTMAALAAGVLSEWRATILARETAILTVEDRATVDRLLCSDLTRLEGVGDQQLGNEARGLAHRLDPAAAVRRARKAEADRHVSIRPAPDTMVRVSALVPVAQGVAMYAALKKQADCLTATGDPRSRGQLMADTLIERVTGQAKAEAVPVAVNLVMTAKSLFGTGATGADLNESAHLDGYGPVPAGWARDLVRTALDQLGPKAAGWLRRVFSDPTTGDLLAMDSRSRSFPEGLDRFIAVRDAGVCRTSWCDAPIRHVDHVVAVEDGGKTTGPNGQGLCEQCNHAKQAPGWQATTRAGPRHAVHTTTPTGHTHRSTAPPLPGTRPALDVSWGEERFVRLLRSA